MPFAIQRIHTDRGTGFFAEPVQRRLKSECIKCRPIPPRSPDLNGKVERSQLTDLVEYRARDSPKYPEINQRVEEWQFDYKWQGSHGALSGRTPADRIAMGGESVPLRDEVIDSNDANRERIQFSNWKIDQAMIGFNPTINSMPRMQLISRRKRR